MQLTNWLVSALVGSAALITTTFRSETREPPKGVGATGEVVVLHEDFEAKNHAIVEGLFTVGTPAVDKLALRLEESMASALRADFGEYAEAQLDAEDIFKSELTEKERLQVLEVVAKVHGSTVSGSSGGSDSAFAGCNVSCPGGYCSASTGKTCRCRCSIFGNPVCRCRG